MKDVDSKDGDLIAVMRSRIADSKDAVQAAEVPAEVVGVDFTVVVGPGDAANWRPLLNRTKH
jgi:hypothetical protein